MKLVHGLANTNCQNHLYYNTSPLCPICNEVEETFEHVLTCKHPSTTSFRDTCLAQLDRDLNHINTPSKVVSALLHGFLEWSHSDRPSSQSRAPTAGSLRGPDIILTSAYTEQFQSLGWYQLCLGRVSRKWSQAVNQYEKQEKGTGINQEYWSSLLMSTLWKFTKNTWAHSNQKVHGQTADEQAAVILRRLQDKVQEYYASFQADNAFVLPRHQYLFTHCTLAQRLCLFYDHLTCWIRSVEEARAVLHHQIGLDRTATQRFFQQFRATNPTHNTEISSSSGSSYLPSDASNDQSVFTSYTSMTVATTVTMSDASNISITSTELHDSLHDTSISDQTPRSGTTLSYSSANTHVSGSPIPTNIHWGE